MDSESDPAAARNRLGATWQLEPFPRSPRPWLLATLTLACVALVIVGSLGPWLYIEDGPARALEVSTLSGVDIVDGAIALFFALVAAVLVLVALVRPTLWLLTWGAFVAMILCSLVGLFDWVVFDPMGLTGQGANLIRVEWGLKLLTVAGPAGAICAFLLARHLMQGDY